MIFVSYRYFKRALSNTSLELLKLFKEHNLSTRESSPNTNLTL